MSENLTLQLSKIVKASRSRVFAAWTQPEELMRWFAPGPMRATAISVEPQVNGTFRWSMQGPSPRTGQEMEITFTGRFLAVVPDALLRFTWQSEGSSEDSTIVTVAFKDAENGTEVALTQERILNQDIVNRNKMGWGSMLDKLASVCEPVVAHVG